MDAVFVWILSAVLILGGAWASWRRRKVLGPLLLIAGLGLSASLWASRDTGDFGEVSSDSVKRDASFVLRAELVQGRSGEDAARLVQKWIDLAGVAGTHGDAGKHVWVYGDPDATVTEMDAAMAAMLAEKIVVSVVRER